MKNGNGYLFFFFLFLLIGVLFLLSKKDQKSEALEALQPVASMKVEYQIQYGTIYTGDQTPIIYKGFTSIPIKEGNGIGANGLPISGIFPTHSDLVFNLNGSQATLHIPTLLLDSVTGLLELKDLSRALMTVRVSKKENGAFLIQAFPTPPVHI